MRKHPTKAACTLFDEYYQQQTKEPYVFDGKAVKSMSLLLGKIIKKHELKNLPTDDMSILASLKQFLKVINDKWILENLSIAIVNSKFNELYVKAKERKRTMPFMTIKTPDELEKQRQEQLSIQAGYIRLSNEQKALEAPKRSNPFIERLRQIKPV